jgi:hypothetical protein
MRQGGGRETVDMYVLLPRAVFRREAVVCARQRSLQLRNLGFVLAAEVAKLGG